MPTGDTQIVIGWKVDRSQDPQFWKSDSANLAKVIDADLVLARPEDLDAHTAIIAQSGSGKSFFLGSLLEEILVKTKCECTIIDPNSDFRKLPQVVDCEEHWGQKGTHSPDDAKAPPSKQNWQYRALPYQAARSAFAKQWEPIAKHISVLVFGDDGVTPGGHLVPARFRWIDLPVSEFASGLPTMQRHAFDAHHALVLSLESYFSLECVIKHVAGSTAKNLKDPVSAAMELVKLRCSLGKTTTAALMADDSLIGFFDITPTSTEKDKFYEYKEKVRVAIETVENEHVAKEPHPIATLYTSQFKRLQGKDLIQKGAATSSGEQSRVRVLDLPSFAAGDRHIVAFGILSEVWRRMRSNWNEVLTNKRPADKQVPHFVIIDEAHNLVPAESVDGIAKLIKEEIVRIAAEGRKYGLFLILVSQRPDKIDPRVLSECENKVILRIGSTSVLRTARKLLALEDVPRRDLERVLDFRKGGGLLAGKWSPDPQFFFGHARRTQEGTPKMSSRFWAAPPI